MKTNMFELLHYNFDALKNELDVGWPMPRSEKELMILRRIDAMRQQLLEVEETYHPNSVRRISDAYTS